MTRRRSRIASALAAVIVPTRPTNMSTMMTYLPLSGRIGVIPVDRPTVAKALMTSNRMRSRDRSVSWSSRRVEIPTTAEPMSATATLRRTVGRVILRPKASMFWSPRASAATARSRTAKVETLIPPAVEADPPPMNIRASWRNQVASCMCSGGIVDSPEERALTPLSSAVSSLPPMERGP